RQTRAPAIQEIREMAPRLRPGRSRIAPPRRLRHARARRARHRGARNPPGAVMLTADQVAVIAAEIFGSPIGTSRSSKWRLYNGARVHRDTGECDLGFVGVPIEVVYDVYTDLAKKGKGNDGYSANRDRYLAELGIEKEEEKEEEPGLPINELPPHVVEP